VQPQTWLSAQQLAQLAKISDLWLIIEPVHLLAPIKGVPPDGRVFGGMPFEIGVLNSTGDGVRWGDSMAEAAPRLEKVLRAAAPEECGGGGGAGGSYVGSKLSGFKVAQNPPGLNCRALLGRPHGLQTDASERQVGAFHALAAIAPAAIVAKPAQSAPTVPEQKKEVIQTPVPAPVASQPTPVTKPVAPPPPPPVKPTEVPEQKREEGLREVPEHVLKKILEV
jgi:hypothetical protein